MPALLAAGASLPGLPHAATEELPLTGPAYRLADEAYRAYDRGNYAAAAARAREAIRLRPDVQRLQALLRASEDAAQRQTRAADSGAVSPPIPARAVAVRRAASPRPRARPGRVPAASDDMSLPGPPYRIVGAPDTGDGDGDGDGHPMLQIARSLARPPAARAAGPAPVEPAPMADAGPGTPVFVPSAPAGHVEQAYGFLRDDRSREAATAFAHADRSGSLRPAHLLDAAYASLRAGDSSVSAAYFRRALDAADAGEIVLDPQARQDIRLAVADQERAGGASAALFYRGGGTLPGLATDTGSTGTAGDRSDRSVQAVAEGYWRPRELKGFAGGGTFVDLYGRVLGTPYSGAGYAEGASSAQAAVGVRARPLSAVNLVVAAERLVKVGSASRSDWLLRAGISENFGVAPRVDRDSWWSGDGYAEAGRYLQAGEKYLVSEGRLGRSWRLDAADRGWPGLSQATLMPHVVLAADYNTGFARPRAVGAGVGMNLRSWWREDARSGPRSYADLSAQYRWRVAGDDRAGGLVLRLSYNY
ncbi:NfrA family protein [Xylophilus ampelinus]|nr:hypothetical protein [Xylophilus ampelinus]MCS4510504.1 bacteriophage N4 adsorption protein A [Xylophilus ampelinus]